MRFRPNLLALLAILVTVAGCSGGLSPTAPGDATAAGQPATEAETGFAVEASGNVTLVKLAETPLGVEGRARGRWLLSIHKGDENRLQGSLSVRARTRAGEVGLRGRILRAALQDNGSRVAFAGTARVTHGGRAADARFQASARRDGPLRLALSFAGGTQGGIFGAVESFQIGS